MIMCRPAGLTTWSNAVTQHLAFTVPRGLCMHVCFYFCVFVCVISVKCVRAPHLHCCVINDSGGKWTSVVSPFWLFWADLAWVGRGGHEASGDPKILGCCLTCTSVSAPQGCLCEREEHGLHTRTCSVTGKGRLEFTLIATLCWEVLFERPIIISPNLQSLICQASVFQIFA